MARWMRDLLSLASCGGVVGVLWQAALSLAAA